MRCDVRSGKVTRKLNTHSFSSTGPWNNRNGGKKKREKKTTTTMMS
jgi:hypothetical protein